MGKGARGAFRLIVSVDHEAGRIVPLLIYAKNQRSDVAKDEIEQAIKDMSEVLSNPDLPMDES